jgi:hypothetical protein
MIRAFCLVGLLLCSSGAFANQFSTALQSYVACLESSYSASAATTTDATTADSKATLASATFASCADQRARVVATLPLGDADPVLAKVEGVARTEMNK